MASAHIPKARKELSDERSRCDAIGIRLVTHVQSTTEHSHDGDMFEIDAIKLRKELMDAADANRGNSGQILADKLVSYPVEVRAAAGHKETLKRPI